MRQNNVRKKIGDSIFILPSLIPLLLLFCYPLLKGIFLTFHKSGEAGWTFFNYITFFTQHNFYDTIPRTFMLVFPASILELAIAFAMAYYLRKNIKGKQLLKGLIIFPLTLGPLIVAVGMIDFFKPTGWLNLFLMGIGIVHQPVKLLYNYWGTFIALVILGTAFMFSNLMELMETIDPNLELAAISLGAGEFMTFRRVFLPLIRSSVLTVYGLNFIMQLAVFESAILVGNPASDSRSFSVVAFQSAMQDFNYNMATTVAIVMGITQLISLGVIFFIRKKGYIGAASTFK
ncbi:ABC transporter permease subunit [Fodinisporobacter ferrooxydans]|uniref:ABC transporter permease subunit n=1 Tax=Fodinisporobacter ferrooxydans TaxID=2901836 RepID=A0ABY4CMF0_9BACL|nr:ABC transporter permease subunit [Alicyclobacillaceae bacterium MYW30-H2]